MIKCPYHAGISYSHTYYDKFRPTSACIARYMTSHNHLSWYGHSHTSAVSELRGSFLTLQTIP